MRVQLLVYMVGPRGSFEPGDIVDVSEMEALRLIDTQQAVPIEAEPETASIGPTGSMTKKRGRPRRKHGTKRSHSPNHTPA